MEKITKKSFRKFCLSKLKKSAKIKKISKDKRVLIKLKYLLNTLNKNSILIYTPLDIEVNVMPLIQSLRAKKSVFVPFMQGVSFKMVKFRLPLKRGKFNIFEASNSLFNLSRVDVAIVPIVGVDREYKRIGFGKGMYDRFFSNLKYKPIIIFVQIEKCFTNEKLSDNYDIDCDYLVTPKEILRVKGKRVDRVYIDKHYSCY